MNIPLRCCIAALVMAAAPVQADEASGWLAPAAAGDGQLTVEAAERASPAPAGSSEGFLGIIGGNVEVAGSDLRATYQCYFCAPVTVQQPVQFSGGGSFGLRAGIWGAGAWRPAGLAVEVGGSRVAGDQVRVRYQGFGIAPLLRLPLVGNTGTGRRQVAAYGGVLLFRLTGGTVDVDFPGLPRPLSGTPTGMAKGVLLGVSARFGRLGLMLEGRRVDLRVTLDSMAGDEADFRLDSTQTLVGVNYCF